MNKKELLHLADCACQTIMATFTPKELPPAEHFHYHQGVFLDGMYRVWQETKNPAYFDYIKGYYDCLIDEQGNLYFDRDQLDSLQVGLLLFPLYEETGEERYLIAAKKLLHIIYGINKTTEGGFWHKDKYPYQMWLDGLYMAGPFLLKCAQYFQLPDLVEQVIYQESLMRKHMLNEETGLLYHAWDEKRQQPWANAETGCSPEVWGRSAGWYGTALADILKALPKHHSSKDQLLDKLNQYIAALFKYQDQKSRCWYQIVDKGDKADNWLESSCSALFVYTAAEAARLGFVPKAYVLQAEEALTGITDQMVRIEGGRFELQHICIGTSAGSYEYYAERPTSVNDLHGVGAFLWAVMAVYGLQG